MRNLKYILGCLLVLIILASCGSNKPVVMQDKNTTITETLHDTVVKIEKDSSSLKALLECQNGKVVVKNIVQSESGRTLKSPEVQIVDNVLNVDCETPAQKIVIQYKNITKSTVIRITNTLYTNILTFWQKLQIWGFRIYAGLTVLLFCWVYIKSKI
jgi:hypothetical protein